MVCRNVHPRLMRVTVTLKHQPASLAGRTLRHSDKALKSAIQARRVEAPGNLSLAQRDINSTTSAMVIPVVSRMRAS